MTLLLLIVAVVGMGLAIWYIAKSKKRGGAIQPQAQQAPPEEPPSPPPQPPTMPQM